MDADPADLLLPIEVAKMLRVSVSALYKWRRRKHELPFVKMSHAVRYRRGDVNSFIEARVQLRQPAEKRRSLKRVNSKQEPRA